MSNHSGSGPFDAQRQPASVSAGPRLPRVLIVDDEPRALTTLGRLLKKRFDVVTSDRAAHALSLLAGAGDFAIVIADLSMPEMNGFEFLDRVQQTSPLTARLALTGISSLDSGNIAPDAVFRVLRKPCPPELLFQAFADAGEYHALLSASPLQPVESSRTLPRAPLEPRLDLAPAITFRKQSPSVPRLSLPAARIGLRTADRSIELLPGVTIVGRHRTCHIPLDDPKVSHCHACFSYVARQLTVRNLSGTHPLLLNDIAVGPGEHALQVGDRLPLGSQELEVCLLRDYSPSLEPTEHLSELPNPSPASPSNSVATLGALANVSEKYVRLGRGHDAERLLRPLLEGLLRFCRAGEVPLVTDITLAVELALGLAEANTAGVWVSYVFELLRVIEQPPEQAALDRLYRIIPATPGISMASYRSYVDALLGHLDRFGPGPRFVIRRLQGLQAALLRSAHV